MFADILILNKMTKGVLFEAYKKCYYEARSRNTELNKSERKCIQLLTWVGAVLGILIGAILVRKYFKEESFLYQSLIIEIGCFAVIFLLLYSFNVYKAIKEFKNNILVNLKGILQGDWRTQHMKQNEQIKFKENLILNNILLKDNEQKNCEVLEVDIKYFLSIAGRKELHFKENLGTNTKIAIFFIGAFWTTYIKDISMNYSLLNAILISVMVLLLVFSLRIYINRMVLFEAKECLVICDELTEIRNDIIRKGN